MTVKKTLSILSLVLCLTLQTSFLFAKSSGKQVELLGNKAPNLSGKQALGKGMIKLRSLKKSVGYEKDKHGKFKVVNDKFVLKITKNVVVLNFFSTTCIPCVREIPTYNKLAKHYKSKNVKLIYVNVDPDMSSDAIERFIIRRKIKVPMMMPNQKEAIEKYQIYGLPRMVIIGKEGRVQKIITGFSEHLEEELSQIIDSFLDT